ncbi:hypothetical protein E6P09_18170 (plasmid) [Haloferax mediterranei ATCC 33500]|uniref:DUF8071 domain-containing protein n=1 Tax=Haloferax mediterranei (strain ATCC 33500 / DSM 1411 / JCM 8866 / NBRC 14739 / NCIMB 2177 / R-4) TaxID=523841 RepID=I3RA34_HALMT|nr:hypothetical protein [Haloferax mediterranei]AFK21094.1 hypothetical protein HFX_5262 [Haloferax mediterranei ATCC 33500]AHZ24318.1 hypothetical protein BM92_19155 [Haloferax mediterranei ATCC 33500]EMA05404.1 hypothetical protein C439_01355 [Haloferax mediterranei ATCC 33500]MDX5989798.1 hypothetical protein [Haloferax mediterranei ATCC 33500]QCQ77242.1 hypothetical protein E6P09_18170 [Haloferax mediterranei ATCC 33500]
MPTNTSTVQSVAGTGLTYLVAALAFIKRVGVLTIAWLYNLLKRVWRFTRTATTFSLRRTRELLNGPVRDIVTGPLRRALFGRRVDISLGAVLLAPIIALVTAWWVGSTFGYYALEEWALGTWNGTNPTALVFLGFGFLLAVGTVSAAVNNGLIPTAVLVSAPIFGAAVTRYGTEVTYHWGTTIVSLPNALGVATLIALGVGTPIAICGWLLGVAVRSLIRFVGLHPEGIPQMRSN